MNDILPGNELHYLFSADECPSSIFKVVEFAGYEQLSRPFEIRIQLASERVMSAPSALLGAQGLLTIRSSGGDRYIHGVLLEVRRLEIKGRYELTEVLLVPKIQMLSLRRKSRIFQKRSTLQIIETVLRDGEFGSEQFRIASSQSYGARDYCVQYRESDLDFIHRLMEEEGLFYFFEHSRIGDMLVIADDPAVYLPLPEQADIRYNPPGGMTEQSQVIQSFELTECVRTGAVALRDYSYKKPQLALDAIARSGKNHALEIYDYPGEYVDPDIGQRLATVRLEEQTSQGLIGRGSSDCRVLRPGYLFTLANYSRMEYNTTYLITAVRHHGTQAQVLDAHADTEEQGFYRNTFSVQPSSIPFRSARVTARPSIPGVQTATVVGPDGEEIYTDGDGRIKVQFHWDRDGETSPEERSCWVRVTQPWAGDGFGAVFVPRIGHEVVVQFLEGDPDRPIITGCVYNGQNLPPYGVDGRNTQTAIKSNTTPGGAGFNELRFEDAKGKEQVFVHAQKDWFSVVRECAVEQIGDKWTVDIGEEVVFTCGDSSIRLTKSGLIEIRGVDIVVNGKSSIKSTAGGEHVIDGGVVKVNC